MVICIRSKKMPAPPVTEARIIDIVIIIFQLFSDRVPKTCANFKALCTGEKGVSEETDLKLAYANSLFHRIVRNGWIQGGGENHLFFCIILVSRDVMALMETVTVV